MMITRRTAALTLVLLSLVFLLGTGGGEPPANSEKGAEPAPTVRLTIDYKDGVQKSFVAIPHREKMTVLDALVEASRHARGIKLDYSGKGETAFVKQIDDLMNQGGGKASRNWQFWVNDKLATRGCGATPLAVGDVVVWAYETKRVAD